MSIKVEIGSPKGEWLSVIDEYTGVMTLATAILSIVIAIIVYKSQKKHNELSVIPVPFIALADYEDLIRVKIRNDGLGPLFVEKIDIIEGEKLNEHENLVSYLPNPPSTLSWSNFSSGFVRSIRPGDELILIEMPFSDETKPHVNYREILRKKLSVLTIRVSFTCAYGRKHKPIERELSFFARRLSSSKFGTTQ